MGRATPRARRPWAPAALLAACACAQAGCVYQPSEVLVLLDTNVPVDQALRIRATLRAGDAAIAPGTPADHEWVRALPSARDAGVDLPASFALVPPLDGPDDGLATLLVEGVTVGYTLRRTVRFRFVPHETLVLRVFLSSECDQPASVCPQGGGACTRQAYCESLGQTCGDDGNCVPVLQQPTADAGALDARAGCTPSCETAACGAPDGCGGRCQYGACNTGEVCVAGRCACGDGFVRCGADCRAVTSVECSPGQTSEQGCPMCGTQQRSCDAATCTWEAWGACMTGGVCAPGATQQQACGNCGSQTRTCDAMCTWSGWGTCGGQGACAPNSTQQGGCDPCAHETCTASCAWDGACVLNSGAQCEWQSGTHHRTCSACQCGLQFCLPSCAWSTSCVSFCGGSTDHMCHASCPSGC